MPTALKQHLMVLAGYISLTLIMTAPLPLFLGSHVAGTGGDPWQTMWRFEEKWAYLGDDLSLIVTEFFGTGEPRLVNLSVWPWMWAHALLGQPAAYNLVWLLSFVLAGYGMYLFVNQLLSNDTLEFSVGTMKISAVAFLTGAAYMFLPYRVAHAQGHFGAMQTGWLPLIALCTVLLFRQPTAWRLIALALLLVVQAWTEHHYFLWLLVLGAVAACFYRSDVRAFLRDRSGIIYGASLAGLMFLFVFLPYWPTIQLALQSDTQLALGEQQAVRFSADPFAYLLPAPFHSLWGKMADFLFAQHFTGNQFESTQYLGLVPLLLVSFFWKSIPRQQRLFWGTVACLFLVLSLGPRLHLLGRVTTVVLPYALIDELPPFSSVRAVARAGMMVGFSGMILFALVLQRQLHRSGAALGVLGLLLLDFLFWPAPMQPARLSRVYQEVPSLPGTSLIDLPAATNYAAASRALFASGRHGKDVVGNIALERAHTGNELADARSLPAIRQLLFLRTEHILSDRTDFFEQEMAETLPDTWRYLDVRGIVVHRDSLSATQMMAVHHILEEVLQLPQTDFGDAVLYRVPAELAGDDIFLARDENWVVTVDAPAGISLARLDTAAAITLYNIDTRPKQVSLTFTLSDTSEGSLLVSSGEHTLFDETKSPDEKEVRLRVTLVPGATTVNFANRLPGPVIIENPRLIPR